MRIMAIDKAIKRLSLGDLHEQHHAIAPSHF
jgi:hypothetical protein